VTVLLALVSEARSSLYDVRGLGWVGDPWPIRCAPRIPVILSPMTLTNTRPMAIIYRLGFSPHVMKLFAKYFYPFVTRRFGTDETLFINGGYEEDPPMALPLAASDEPDRFCIQLYHRTATQVDLNGKRVLEVSCGHGGGASYLMRTVHPASYTGLDLNPAGVTFCRKRHNLPGLNFMQGNAENLPFADQSVDAVINIEASHTYPRFTRFLAEVARLLRPGGHFLYADLRPRLRIAEWEAALADAPMRMVSHSVINAQVLRAVEKNSQRSQDLISRHLPTFLRGLVRHAMGARDSKLCHALQSGEFSYRMYCFAKD
jgi:ubiquinone/menaquinone biosynthesis C-methylase UbiE